MSFISFIISQAKSSFSILIKIKLFFFFGAVLTPLGKVQKWRGRASLELKGVGQQHKKNDTHRWHQNCRYLKLPFPLFLYQRQSRKESVSEKMYFIFRARRLLKILLPKYLTVQCFFSERSGWGWFKWLSCPSSAQAFASLGNTNSLTLCMCSQKANARCFRSTLWPARTLCSEQVFK